LLDGILLRVSMADLQAHHSQEHLSAEVHCIKSSQEDLMKIDKVVLTAIAFSLTVIAVLVLKNIGVL